jgi:hypothetical protein
MGLVARTELITGKSQRGRNAAQPISQTMGIHSFIRLDRGDAKHRSASGVVEQVATAQKSDACNPHTDQVRSRKMHHDPCEGRPA